MAAQSFAKINLLPKDSFEFSTLGKTLKWALSSGRVMVVLTEFVVILAFGSRFYYDRKLNDLIETIDQKQAVIESYVDIEKQMRDILARKKVVDIYLRDNLKTKERIASVARVTPINVKYDEISFEIDSFNLSGTAGSEAGFYQVIAGLGSLPFVESVSIAGVNFDQKLGLVSFKINAAFSKTKT